MSIEIELPSLGEGIKGGDIAEILVSVGDVIESGQILMELETDKAVLEVPASQGGTIEKILVASGDSIVVGQTLVIVSNGGASPKKPVVVEPAKVEPPQPTKSTSPTASDKTPSTATPKKTEMVTGSVVFELPNLGEGISGADVAEIMVSVGDVIEAEDIVMELETDKAVVELPCPHAGKITKIMVSEGDSIKVGAAILTIEATSTVGESKSSSPAPSGSSASSKTPSASPPATEVAHQPHPETFREASPQVEISQPAKQTSDSNGNRNGIPIPAAPSTRRLARQLGVNLRLVNGTASGGRITAEDVQGFVKRALQTKELARTAPSSSGHSLMGLAPPPLPDFSKYGVIEREKMNKLSRTAAENLTLSWNVIPHVTQHDRVDITDLESARKRFSAGIGKNGPKVTMTAIVMKALAKCLQSYPKFNSSLDPETNEIVYKKYYNLGCAVDTPNGLVVPVVRDCDSKSILQIAADITDLAVRARDRKLKIDEMQGATCTITNLGGIGGVAFTPIVNYPEVCILGMCRGQQELKMIDGQIVERLILPLSLSYDHRVVNGADAARFVVTLTELLGDPFQLLTTV